MLKQTLVQGPGFTKTPPAQSSSRTPNLNQVDDKLKNKFNSPWIKTFFEYLRFCSIKFQHCSK